MFAWLLAGSAVKGIPIRLIVAALAALALLASLIVGLNSLHESIKQSGRDEILAQWSKAEAARQKARADLNADLALALNGVDGSLHEIVEGISRDKQDITVRVRAEMGDDPRYTSPDCALPDGVRNSIDAARRLSDPYTAAGGSSGEVSGFEPVTRIDLGRPGS